MSIADLRREYARARLDEADVSHDPFVEFARWFANGSYGMTFSFTTG